MAVGEDRADVRLLEEVALDAPDEEVLFVGDQRSPTRRSPVRTSSTPTSVRPIVPVSLRPASIGTSCPASSPI